MELELSSSSVSPTRRINMKRVICLSPGYVESQRVWKTFFMTSTPYEDEEAALNSLALDFLEVYRNEIYYAQRKCCRAFADAKTKDDAVLFCSTCGAKLGLSIDEEQLGYFVEQILASTAESFNADLTNWWPWNLMSDLLKIPADDWVFIEDNYAEQKMAQRMLRLAEITANE